MITNNKILIKRGYGDNKTLKVELFKSGKIFLVQETAYNKKLKPKKFLILRHANAHYDKIMQSF